MFTKAGVTLADIRTNGRKVVRKDGKQILLILAGERVFAIANRCPHEGYPLVEGALDDACVLTCHWHNWKFDLRSGATIYGGDTLRVYPVKVEGGRSRCHCVEKP
jgi:nitrite reductase/ring-hydroxylating ferredoxin subunit